MAKPRKVRIFQEGRQPEVIDDAAEVDQPIPAHWGYGALLNVRNAGPEYIITLWPEEFNPEAPERAMRFTNPARCQDFVSKWYARQHHDPLAMR